MGFVIPLINPLYMVYHITFLPSLQDYDFLIVIAALLLFSPHSELTFCSQCSKSSLNMLRFRTKEQLAKTFVFMSQ